MHDLDEYVQSHLVLAALNIALHVLEAGGTFVAKIFRGANVDLLYDQLGVFFEQITCCKPRSSRNSSFEAFVVAKRLSLPAGFDPKQLTAVLNDPSILPKQCGLVQFVAAGSLSDPDADKSYALPEEHHFIPPIQPPTIPPYKDAVQLKRGGNK